MKTPLVTAAVLTSGLFVAGCADTPYQPILDGPQTMSFQSDLNACRQASLQRQSNNSGATGGAVVGGLVGAVDADSGDEIGGLIAGAVIGGLIGSVDDSSQVQDQRDQIVFQCMRGRGHKVIG